MTDVLRLVPNPQRGSVQISANDLPNGSHATVARVVPTGLELIRQGEFTVTTGGFVLTDSEAPYGVPVEYRLTLDRLPTRIIQRNLVTNPKAGLSTIGWAPGVNRSVNREIDPSFAPPRDATTSFRFGSNTSGATSITPATRTIGSTPPSNWTTGRYFVSGQVLFDSPDLRTWSDVLGLGTWADVLALGTWQQVKTSGDAPPESAFTSLHAMVISGTDSSVLVAPFQVLGAEASRGGDWLTFSFYIDLPAGIPANSRLAFLHGTDVREFAVTWHLSTIMVTPASQVTAESLLYFDGDTPLPANPASPLLPGYDWEPAVFDASIAWTGSEEASTSVFTGPSAIASKASITLATPVSTGAGRIGAACSPVLLSDPVYPSLAQWFGLLSISALSYAARQDFYTVLGRAGQIAVSQTRGLATGELSLLTRTADEELIAERLFASGRILYLRNPDPRYPETSWYLAIGDTTASRLAPTAGYRRERTWTVPFTRVERPVGAIAYTLPVTWQDIRDGYASWADLRARRSDWLDAALTAP